MKKFGFTLAEVLITLGIIGVVAALTAPALVMSSRNEANAAKLSVAVSNLENAFGNMIVQENANNLFDTRAWQNRNSRPAFAGNLGQYMHINGYKDLDGEDGVNTYYGTNPPCGMDANGARNAQNNISWFLGDGNAETNHIIETKNGATYFILPYGNQNVSQAQKDAMIALGGALFEEAADVYIDVNGAAVPNTVGRDIFAFYLGENGILYPVGGMDVSIFDSQGTNKNNVWDVAIDNRGCADGRINEGWGCTARVIEEGYKMNY